MGNIKHSKAKPQFSILILITTIVFLLQFSKASASEYDICVNVLEEITNPVNEYNCWPRWIKKKNIFGFQIQNVLSHHIAACPVYAKCHRTAVLPK